MVSMYIMLVGVSSKRSANIDWFAEGGNESVETSHEVFIAGYKTPQSCYNNIQTLYLV